MTPERRVAIVTDSCCSIRPEHNLAQELGITVIPVEIIFFEGGQHVPYSDFDLPSSEFYQKMRGSRTLPQTSGAIQGRAYETYSRLSNETDSIFSIHVTTKHSVVCASAITARGLVNEEKPDLQIEVVDSKSISLGIWFLAEHAARLSQQNAPLQAILDETVEMIPKVHLLTVLQSFDNLKKGGRADELVKAYLASILSICPVLGLKDGKLSQLSQERTPNKARNRMIQMVGDSGTLARVTVLHTNAPTMAEEIRESLRRIYDGEIPIFEAGPVLGIHAGEGAVGVAFQNV